MERFAYKIYICLPTRCKIECRISRRGIGRGQIERFTLNLFANFLVDSFVSSFHL